MKRMHFLFFYSEVSEVMRKNHLEHYELILVNDGSKDATLSIMRELATQDPHVKYISFSRNFGKEAAMYAGFCNAKGDYVAVMDADMQDPPSLLPKMLEILQSGEYDSVATRRVSRAGEPPVRSWFARKFYKIINRISDSDVVDGARDFRLMRRQMVDAIVAMGEHNRFSKGIFGWIGFRTFWMEYENVERVAGQTKWNFRKLFKYALDGIVDFSESPLSVSFLAAGIFGFLFFAFAIFMIVWTVGAGHMLLSWMPIVLVILLAAGIQMACMGIMGLYIAKTHTEVQNRPHYILSETNIDDAIYIY